MDSYDGDTPIVTSNKGMKNDGLNSNKISSLNPQAGLQSIEKKPFAPLQPNLRQNIPAGPAPGPSSNPPFQGNNFPLGQKPLQNLPAQSQPFPNNQLLGNPNQNLGGQQKFPQNPVSLNQPLPNNQLLGNQIQNFGVQPKPQSQFGNNSNPPPLSNAFGGNNPGVVGKGFVNNASNPSNIKPLGNNPNVPQNSGANFMNAPKVNQAPGIGFQNNQILGAKPNAPIQNKGPASEIGLDNALRNSGVGANVSSESKNLNQMALNPGNKIEPMKIEAGLSNQKLDPFGKPVVEQPKFGQMPVPSSKVVEQPKIGQLPPQSSKVSDPFNRKSSNGMENPGIIKESSPEKKFNAEENKNVGFENPKKLNPSENESNASSSIKSNQSVSVNNPYKSNNPSKPSDANVLNQPSVFNSNNSNPSVPVPANNFGQPGGFSPPKLENNPKSVPANNFGQPGGFSPPKLENNPKSVPVNNFGQPGAFNAPKLAPANNSGLPSGFNAPNSNPKLENPPQSSPVMGLNQSGVLNPSKVENNPNSGPANIFGQPNGLSAPNNPNVHKPDPSEIKPAANPNNFPIQKPEDSKSRPPPPLLPNNNNRFPNNSLKDDPNMYDSGIKQQKNPADDKFVDPKFNYVQSSLILDQPKPQPKILKLVPKKKSMIKIEAEIPKDLISLSFKKINEDEIAKQYSRIIENLLHVVDYNTVIRNYDNLIEFFQPRKSKSDECEKILNHFAKQLKCDQCGNTNKDILLELNCTHMLCRACLERQANQSIQRKIFQCPLCRKELNESEESAVWEFLGLNKAQKKKMQLEAKYKDEKQLKCKKCKKFKKKFYKECYHICKECFSESLRWKIAPCEKCHDSINYENICNEQFSCSNCSNTRYFVGSYGKFFKDENYLFCLDCSYDFFNEGENVKYQIKLSKLEKLELNDHIFAPCDGCKEELFKGNLELIGCQHKLCEKCREKPNCLACFQR